MPEGRFRDQEHLLRLAGLALAGLLLFLVVRGLLVPEGFGLYGHYRAGALDDNRAHKAAFAGRAVCGDCHTDAADTLKVGGHKAIGCEACHGPLARHASADDPAAAKPKRPEARLCLVCHLPNAAKPRGFPQVALKDHAEPGTCFTCHKPHHPGEAPPEAAAAPEKSS